jgi:ribosomal protein L35AE/L33A
MIRKLLQAALYLFLSPLLMAQGTGDTPHKQTVNQAVPDAAGRIKVILPKHTMIDLTNLEALSSATAYKGQKVPMAVASDVIVKGHVVIPRGTPATGVVTSVRKAIPGKRDGYLMVDQVTLDFPGSSSVALQFWTDPSGDGFCTGFFTCDLPLSIIVGVSRTGELIAKPFRKNHVTGNESSVWSCQPYLEEPRGKIAIQPIETRDIQFLPTLKALDAICPRAR